MKDTIQFIADYLIDSGVVFDGTVIGEYNFIKSGAIDSFSLLSLIMEIEAEYGIKITTDDLLDESLATISGMASLISKKLTS